MKRTVSILLLFLLISTLVPPVISGANTPLGSLEIVEEMLYGETKTGALVQRIEQVELDVYDQIQQGAILVRIDRVLSFLATSSGETPLQLLLNLSEWGFSATVSGDLPLLERLEILESTLYGEKQTTSIAKRTERLMLDIWGTTKLDVKRVTLPEKSLVKVSLLQSVDSGKSVVGDEVVYQVVEDVVADGRVVIPKGVRGKARVVEVSSAGRLGKDGRVVIEFGSIVALDGTRVRLRVDERATTENKSLEFAAGASMAGIVLLGPIGLAGGYFVKGKDVKIEAKTHFYVETERSVQTSGFYFRPALEL